MPEIRILKIFNFPVYRSSSNNIYKWVVIFNDIKYLFNRNVIYGLMIGIKDIHKRNIVHRDLKPENIIIKKC